MKKKLFYKIEEKEDSTIISFLKKRLRSTSLNLIYKLFRTKKVLLNKEVLHYYQHRLKKGDEIEILDEKIKADKFSFEEESKRLEKLQKNEFKKIYENENILIVEKDHGIEVNELDEEVRSYFWSKSPESYKEKVENFFVYTSAHRLDKLTKGLIIYPKNDQSKKIIYQAISDKKSIEKKYIAICEENKKKILPRKISGYLKKNELEKKMEFVEARINKEKVNEKAKFCELEVKKCYDAKILKKLKKLFLPKKYLVLEVTLKTGRKHQIRSMLSYYNRPVIGDKKYGSQVKLENKIYLFAYKISFIDLIKPLDALNKKTFEIKSFV